MNCRIAAKGRGQALKHVSALAILFAMVAVVFAITLGLVGGATIGQVLLASVVLTVVAYVVGDLIILPATNTWIGLAADALAVWAVLRLVVPDVAVGAALLWSVIAIPVGGYLYHMYLDRTVING